MTDLPVVKGTMPLTGFRVFSYYTPGFLGDANRTHVYKPREVWEAKCNIIDTDHISPDPSCTCGFWVMKDTDKLIQAGYSGPLWAEVWMWGRIIEGSLGYRTQYMYIKELYLNKKGFGYGSTPAQADRLESELDWLGYIYGISASVKELTNSTSTMPGIGIAAPPAPTYLDIDTLRKCVRVEQLPLELRRVARNQLRMRVNQKLKAAKQRLNNLITAASYCRSNITKLTQEIADLDILLIEWNKKGKK